MWVRPPKPDAPTVAASTTTPKTALAVTWTAPANTGPAISDYDVQYRKQGDTDWTAHAHTGTETATTLSSLESGATYEVQVQAVNAEGDSPWSDSGTGSTEAANAPPNAPPDFVDPDDPDTPLTTATREVAENAPAGANVGTPVTAAAADNDPLTYSLSGSNAFAIDANSGQITVANGAVLDYETTPSYTVTVGASDGKDDQDNADPAVDATIEVTINLIDAGPPAKPDAPTVAASTTTPKTALAVTWTAPANTGPAISGYAVQYRVEGAQVWTAHPFDGAGTAATITSLTPDTTYEAQVRAVSDEGASPWSASGRGSTADQPQARPAAPTVERLRTSTAGETGLTVTWTAPEIPGISGYEVLYREQGEQEWNDYGSSIGSSATSVDITGLSTGTIYEAQWRARNGGSSGTICPEETACDNGGNTSLWSETGSARTNRPPQESHRYNDQNHPVSEAQKVNILDRHSVAQTGPVFTDPDGDPMLLTVSSEYPGLVSTSLLDAGRNIRAEAENPGSSRISYSVSDGYGGSASGSFVFTGHRSVTLQILENSPGGAGVGTPVAGRPYQGGTLTYSLTGAAAAKFAIDSASGQIRLREGSSLDYETGPNTFTGQVEYTVGGGAAVASVTIEVTDVTPPAKPDAPTVARSSAGPRTELDVNWTAPGDGGGAITEYNVQYRVEGAPTWTDFDSAIPGATTRVALPGLQPGTTYEVQVRASNDEGDGPWSASGTGSTEAEADNAPPLIDAGSPDKPDAPTVEASSADPGTILDVSWTAPENTGPPITGYAVQYREEGASSWTSHPFAGTGTATTLSGLTPGTTYEAQVRAVNDEGAGPWSESGRGSTQSGSGDTPDDTPGNTPPGFDDPDNPDTPLATAAREVAENTPAGDPVGAPIVAADADNDPLSYALAGSNAFAIDSGSGQIRVAEGAVLDYETTPSYAVTVSVSDGKDADSDADTADDATITVTIEVINVSEPPGKPDAPTVTTSSTDPNTSLDVSWTAPANTGPVITDYSVRYREQGGQTWTNVVPVLAGSVTSAELSALQPDTTYEVQVRAANYDGVSPWSASGSGSTEAANAPPVFDDPDNPGTPLDTAARQVAENAPGGRPVGAPIAAADADNDVLTYSLAGSDAFVIDAASGQIRVAEGAELDHETTPSYAVTVGASDGKDAAGDADTTDDATVEVTIDLIDVGPPAPPDPPRVTDSSTDPVDAIWTAPANTGPPISAAAAQEGAPPSPSSLSVIWTAPANIGPPITDYDVQYRQEDKNWNSHPFDGTGTTTTITGLTQGATYEVQVLARNAEGDGPWSASGRGRLGRAGAPSNRDPAILDPDTRRVAENTPAGTPVGDPLTATDPDNDRLTYSLSGASAFDIDPSSGRITVASGAALDYEATPSYTVTVGVSDGKDTDGDADSAVDATVEVAIDLIDVDEPPAKPDAPAVAPSAAGPARALDVSWTAPANTGPAITDYDVRYRVEGSAAAFTDAGHDGVSTSLTIGSLEEGTTYEVQIRAVNAEGASPWSDSGVGSTEAPGTPPDGNEQTDEDEPTGEDEPAGGDGPAGGDEPAGGDGPAGGDEPAGKPDAPTVTGTSLTSVKVTWTAPVNNGPAIIVDYDLQYRVADSGGAFTGAGYDGTSMSTTIPNLSADTEYEVQVRASKAEGAGPWSDSGRGRTNRNRAPLAVGTIPNQRLMLGRSGTVDVESFFADPDGDPLRYEASSNGSAVNVNISDSVVALTPMAADGARVTVTASDPHGMSAEQSFMVEVETLQGDSARVLEVSLAAFGRTVAGQAVDAIGDRFEASSRASRATFGGRNLNIGSASDEQGRAAAWLQAAASLLSGRGGSPASHPFTGTAAGRPVLGQTGAGARRAGVQTGFARGGGAGGFGGGSLDLAGGQTGRSGFGHFSSPLSGQDLMTRSSFRLALGRDGSGGDSGQEASGGGQEASGWMLWGQGARSDFSGHPQADLGMDGRVGAAYLGADRRWGSEMLVGLAASHSIGALDLNFDNEISGEGRLGARLTSLHPYVQWSPRQGLGLWGLMGFGRGVAELETDDGSVETDIGVRMAALGGRSDLTRLGAVDLALKADAFAVSVGSEAVEGLQAVNGDARRARLMLDSSTDWDLSPHTRLTPSLALGVRLDGGDAENGLGAELAGGASLANRRLGLEVEARGHWLMAHQARDFKERGASLAVRLDPGADRKGWGFSLAPLWGDAGGSAAADSLWRSERMPAGRYGGDRSEALRWRPNRAQAALSYGLSTWGGRGRLGPFARLHLEGTGSPRLGGGLRFDVLGALDAPADTSAGGLQLEFFGDYRRRLQDSAGGLYAAQGGLSAGPVDYRLGLILALTF